MSATLQYRPDVDGLRAVAVLGVLCYHVSPSALPGGFLGVDIFFVISGYLITQIVLRELSAGTFSSGAFYSRRIRRLFPALAIVLASALGFGAFSLFADEFERLGKHASSAIVFLLNFRLMDEAGYFDITSHAKPLLHLWSLSVEEQFYLVWPFILVLATRLGISSRWTIPVLIAASFAFSAYLAERNADALYFHPLARFWELLVGAALARAHHQSGANPNTRRTRHPVVDILLSFCGLCAISWAFFEWETGQAHPGMLTLLPVLGAAALIASGNRAPINRVLSLKPLVWIGLISYPLYLWHWPVLSYIRIMESGSPSMTLLWAGAGLSVVLAGFTYVLAERPLRVPRDSKQKLLALVSVMFALFLVSRFIVVTDGLPERAAVRYIKAAEAQLKREPRQDDTCLQKFSEGSAPVYCRQQGPAGPLIVITGDSHAHVLFPGIAAEAGARGYGTLLLANSGCPPFDGAVTGRNAAEWLKCALSIETILQAIEAEDSVTSIIIASRGPQYIDGKGFGPAEAHYNHPPIAPRNTDFPAETAPPAVFRNSLERTIHRLHQKGPSIAYLLQVPELGVPARDCLRRPLTLARSASGCAVEYDVYRARMRDYRELVQSIQNSLRYLKVIDPAPRFCDLAHCSGYLDNELLYADDNHLSVTGSIRIAPSIMSTLDLDAVQSPAKQTEPQQ